MAVDDRLRATLAEMKQLREMNALRDGGGGGMSGGMEPRIARLEAHMEHVLDELRKLSPMPGQMALLEERSKHFATKTYAVVTAIAIVVALSAVIVFADQLRAVIRP